MTDLFEFDLFHFCTLTGKQSKNVSLKSCTKLKQVLLLKSSFFKEDISSSISPSSNLHEIYCSNSTPREILLAREDLTSNYVNKQIISNVHSFFTFITSLYDPSTTIFEAYLHVLGICLHYLKKRTTNILRWDGHHINVILRLDY